MPKAKKKPRMLPQADWWDAILIPERFGPLTIPPGQLQQIRTNSAKKYIAEFVRCAKIVQKMRMLPPFGPSPPGQLAAANTATCTKSGGDFPGGYNWSNMTTILSPGFGSFGIGWTTIGSITIRIVSPDWVYYKGWGRLTIRRPVSRGDNDSVEWIWVI